MVGALSESWAACKTYVRWGWWSFVCGCRSWWGWAKKKTGYIEITLLWLVGTVVLWWWKGKTMVNQEAIVAIAYHFVPLVIAAFLTWTWFVFVTPYRMSRKLHSDTAITIERANAQVRKLKAELFARQIAATKAELDIRVDIGYGIGQRYFADERKDDNLGYEIWFRNMEITNRSAANMTIDCSLILSLHVPIETGRHSVAVSEWPSAVGHAYGSAQDADRGYITVPAKNTVKVNKSCNIDPVTLRVVGGMSNVDKDAYSLQFVDRVSGKTKKERVAVAFNPPDPYGTYPKRRT